MPGPDHRLVDVGVGRGTFDAAHRGRLTDVVDLADERQNRTGDVGQRDQLSLDGEAARHHPVVRDELLEQFGHRRPGPCDPALTVEETALLLTRKQRFAVMQLHQELEARFHGLERIEQLKTGARHPTCDVDAVEDMVGEEISHNDAHVGREPARQRGQSVHR